MFLDILQDSLMSGLLLGYSSVVLIVCSEEGLFLLSYSVFALGQGHLLSVPPLWCNLSLGLGFCLRVVPDGGVAFLVHFFHPVCGDSQLDVLRELTLVGLLILLFQGAHVVGYVTAKDVFPVGLCVELFALAVVPRETFAAVGDIHATINSSFESTKDAGTCRCSCKTGIQVCTECPMLTLLALLVELFTVYLRLTFVHGV